MRFDVFDLMDGYTHIAKFVRAHGEDFAPRGQNTKEILGAQIHLRDPYLSMPLDIGRGLNPAIGVAEALQLIAGESHPELMLEKFPNFKNFTDGGGWFHGAYGPRISRQIPKVIKTLHDDYSSRQALVTVWDPAYDGYGDVRDTPCTISMQFFIRHNLLHMVTYMRSNDIWWGLAYDAYQFTMLQINLAHALGCGVGEYTHNVGSLHLYERDWEKVDELHDVGERHSLAANLAGLTWEQKRQSASRILKNAGSYTLSENLLAVALHG